MKTEKIIFESIEDADDSLELCPRPHDGSDGLHWWYIDNEDEERKLKSGACEPDYVSCICKTCGQKMRLDPCADEYPAV